MISWGFFNMKHNKNTSESMDKYMQTVFKGLVIPSQGCQSPVLDLTAQSEYLSKG